jgi:hypothetical protein
MVSNGARDRNSVLSASARQQAADLAPVIAEVQASGARTHLAIAAALNARRVPTASSATEWNEARVGLMLRRIASMARQSR